MRIEREELLRTAESECLHWWLPDGRGGAASGTALGLATLRSHGLLVTPFRGNPRPHAFLSRFEETLSADGRELPLSTARYPGVLAPDGHKFLDAFEPFPLPTVRWLLGDVSVVRRLAFDGDGALLVRWDVKGPSVPRVLSLRPFFPCREAEALTRENVYLEGRPAPLEGGFSFWPYPSLPRVCVTAAGAPWRFEPEGAWFRNVEYAADAWAGRDFREDVFSPGVMRFALDGSGTVVVAAATERVVDDPLAAWDRAEARAASPGRRPAKRRAGDTTPSSTAGALERAAARFPFVDGEGRHGILARWPAGADDLARGLAALPGCTLPRGDGRTCAAVLLDAVHRLEPSAVPAKGADPLTGGDGEADLWWARAFRMLDEEGAGDVPGRDRLDAALLSVAGTRRRMLESPDAPRPSFRAEALRHLLFDTAGKVAHRTGDGPGARTWSRLRRITGEALRDRLAADVAAGDVEDAGAVIAASLPGSPLSREVRADVVLRARRELLTPRGLRLVSPRRGDDGGTGPVSPALLGFFVDAAMRARGRRSKVRREQRLVLDGFAPHLREHGLGLVSESFDGSPPHAPRGAFADAFATGELLRAYGLLGVPPG